jgi:hypothetical protein
MSSPLFEQMCGSLLRCLQQGDHLGELLRAGLQVDDSSSLYLGEYHSAALLMESAFEYQEAYIL